MGEIMTGMAGDAWRRDPASWLFAQPARPDGHVPTREEAAADDMMWLLSEGRDIREFQLMAFCGVLADALADAPASRLAGFAALAEALEADYAYNDADQHLPGWQEGMLHGMLRLAGLVAGGPAGGEGRGGAGPRYDLSRPASGCEGDGMAESGEARGGEAQAFGTADPDALLMLGSHGVMTPEWLEEALGSGDEVAGAILARLCDDGLVAIEQRDGRVRARPTQPGRLLASQVAEAIDGALGSAGDVPSRDGLDRAVDAVRGLFPRACDEAVRRAVVMRMFASA